MNNQEKIDYFIASLDAHLAKAQLNGDMPRAVIRKVIEDYARVFHELELRKGRYNSIMRIHEDDSREVV